MKKTIFGLALAVLLLGGCAAPNVAYFYDFENGAVQAGQEHSVIRFKPEDKLTIVVKTKDPEIASLFNLSIASQRIGGGSTTGGQYITAYTVDSNGNIDFPVLGSIVVAGLTREAVECTIKEMLMSKNLVKDPVIIVDYVNLGFNVLGEVNSPGWKTFNRDCITILDAISMAGDLTLQGKRGNILVMREQEDGSQLTYRIDMQNGDELLNSPAFFVQQNDLIYVEPNALRSRQTTVNGNNVLSASFWFSVISLTASLINMMR